MHSSKKWRKKTYFHRIPSFYSITNRFCPVKTVAKLESELMNGPSVNMVIDLLGMYLSRSLLRVLCGLKIIFYITMLPINVRRNYLLFVFSPLFRLSYTPHKSSNKSDLDIVLLSYVNEELSTYMSLSHIHNAW